MSLPILVLALVAAGGTGSAQVPPPSVVPEEAQLTLEQALAEAQRANATLPVASLDVRIAQEREREAAARRRFQVLLDGDLQIAPGNGYDPVITNLGEERLQVGVEKTLYDGGALRAAAAQAAAETAAAGARYRQSERDVALAVRLQFAALRATGEVVAARRRGLTRLASYRSLLEDRQRAGQPVAPDLLRTRVRQASEQAALVAAEEAEAAARTELNSLMGRQPEAPLAVAPLPAPTAPRSLPAEVWKAAPEVVAAEHQVEAAAAVLAAAEAESRVHVSARADAGFWGSDTTRLVPRDYAASHPGASFEDRLGRDFGYSLTLGFSLPLYDFGAIAARRAQAQLALEKARQQLQVTEIDAHRQLALAVEGRDRAFARYRLLATALPDARDAFLAVESRYRGGTASYLEVLDAFAASVDTAVQASQAELAYRQADALIRRWGGSP